MWRHKKPTAYAITTEDDRLGEEEVQKRGKKRIIDAISQAADPLAVFFHNDREALKSRIKRLETMLASAQDEKRQLHLDTMVQATQIQRLEQDVENERTLAEENGEMFFQADEAFDYVRKYAMHLEDLLMDTTEEKKQKRKTYHRGQFGEFGRLFTYKARSGTATSEDCIDWEILEEQESDGEHSDFSDDAPWEV